MANWVFCNRCFQPPHRTSCFSLTNCGHVYCDACLGKGKKNECLICKAPCRTVLLSKHTDADIQAFFMSIDSLCKKYSRETSQLLTQVIVLCAHPHMLSGTSGLLGCHRTAAVHQSGGKLPGEEGVLPLAPALHFLSLFREECSSHRWPPHLPCGERGLVGAARI
ncbi:putative E3 SUMO-protein ligase RNF212 isoform X11 [Homo sapiens]|uniref:putative E3 SUMO-protein ligase RNF212 isoform X11 n=1 Tax=Homo sapiens TaxID=9606 RepID=UPI0007DC673D|nr:probable E3 SUMO-protein ligase RNF212 isoform X11 [Homo sapiens]|eukprot:XP_016863530.1 probable E3 SUMO-protein ligase RNF212 isoform X7 [Homo sapiens]